MITIACEHCTAVCCKYLAIPLDEPETPRDFDDIRWYLMHEGITVFVEEGDWFIQIRTTCRNLQPDSRCGIYETRPKICREYKAGDCDYTAGDYGYDHLFTHPDEIVEHTRNLAKEARAKKRAKSVRAPRRRLGLTSERTSRHSIHHSKPEART